MSFIIWWSCYFLGKCVHEMYPHVQAISYIHRVWGMNTSKWMHKAIIWVWLTTLWKIILIPDRKIQIMSWCDSWGYSHVSYCFVRPPFYDKLSHPKFCDIWRLIKWEKMTRNAVIAIYQPFLTVSSCTVARETTSVGLFLHWCVDLTETRFLKWK